MQTTSQVIPGPLPGAQRGCGIAEALAFLCKKTGALLKFLLVLVARALWKPVTIFRFFRVPVQIHPTFLVFPVGFFLWDGWTTNGQAGLLFVVELLAVMLLNLFVHEFGHILAARCFGIGTKRMIYHPFGAAAFLDDLPPGKREFWIALAGPLANLLLAGGLWLLKPKLLDWGMWAYLHHGLPLKWTFELLFLVKIGILLSLVDAAFNLFVPVFPMDGGRILRSLLFMGFGTLKRYTGKAALRLATRISVRYVSPIMVLGVMAILFSQTRFLPIWHHAVWVVMFLLLLWLGEDEYSDVRHGFGERGKWNLEKFERNVKSSRCYNPQDMSFEAALRQR